jgi:hypothetical protein
LSTTVLKLGVHWRTLIRIAGKPTRLGDDRTFVDCSVKLIGSVLQTASQRR